MNADQILMEIRETNLSYLMLVSSTFALTANKGCSAWAFRKTPPPRWPPWRPAQIMKIALSNTLLCRMRIDDDMVWNLLTNHGKTSNDSVTRLHANILMAGRHQEAA